MLKIYVNAMCLSIFLMADCVLLGLLCQAFSSKRIAIQHINIYYLLSDMLLDICSESYQILVCRIGQDLFHHC